MPDVRTPVDGESWPQADFYDDAPLWSPSGIVCPPQTNIAAGDLALAVSGLTWSVAIGRARVRGQRYRRTTSAATGTLAVNSNASLSRRDRLVLRRDLAAKTTTVVALQGTAAGSPTNPALTQVEAGVWDQALFSFLVQPNSSTVLADLRDERAFLAPDGSGLPIFLSTVARDANWNTPAIGQRCYVQTGDRLQEWIYTTVGGTAQWTWPRDAQGIISSASFNATSAGFLLSNTTTTNSYAAMAAFTQNGVFVPAGRSLELELTVSAKTDTVASAYDFTLYADSVLRRRAGLHINIANLNIGLVVKRSDLQLGAAGTHNFEAGAQRTGGNGGLFLVNDASADQLQYVVRDLGAA